MYTKNKKTFKLASRISARCIMDQKYGDFNIRIFRILQIMWAFLVGINYESESGSHDSGVVSCSLQVSEALSLHPDVAIAICP